MTGTGITLSSDQARRAEARIRSAGLGDRLRVIEGDFERPPSSVAPADVAFAIESFVHAPDPARVLRACASLVRPRGLLIICDDMRRAAEGEGTRDIDAYRRGWHINTLIDASHLGRLATEAGFEHRETHDLTAAVEIDRPRDRAIAVVVAMLARAGWRWPALDPWAGGTALQTCLRNGWVAYELTVFARR
jgi:SAM-dependent methyltransferase